MTKAGKKANQEVLEGFELQQIPCIYYLAQLSEFSIEVLINSGNKVNAIQSSLVRKLDLCICKTEVDAQKIDNNWLETFGVVIVLF